MKKVKLALIMIFAVIIILPSCKKGENDPFLSLRSRKARLTGEWTLTAGTLTQTHGYDKFVDTYTNTSCTRVYSDSTITFPYTQSLKINKAGTYIWEINDDGYYEKYEGAWYFGRKNKDLNLKSKETVCLACTKYTLTVGGLTNETNYSGTSAMDQPTVLQIDMLKNKEMTILYDGTSVYDGVTSRKSGTMTYEKK